MDYKVAALAGIVLILISGFALAQDLGVGTQVSVATSSIAATVVTTIESTVATTTVLPTISVATTTEIPKVSVETTLPTTIATTIVPTTTIDLSTRTQASVVGVEVINIAQISNVSAGNQIATDSSLLACVGLLFGCNSASANSPVQNSVTEANVAASSCVGSGCVIFDLNGNSVLSGSQSANVGIDTGFTNVKVGAIENANDMSTNGNVVVGSNPISESNTLCGLFGCNWTGDVNWAFDANALSYSNALVGESQPNSMVTIESNAILELRANNTENSISVGLDSVNSNNGVTVQFIPSNTGITVSVEVIHSGNGNVVSVSLNGTSNGNTILIDQSPDNGISVGLVQTTAANPTSVEVNAGREILLEINPPNSQVPTTVELVPTGTGNIISVEFNQPTNEISGSVNLNAGSSENSVSARLDTSSTNGVILTLEPNSISSVELVPTTGNTISVDVNPINPAITSSVELTPTASGNIVHLDANSMIGDSSAVINLNSAYTNSIVEVSPSIIPNGVSLDFGSMDTNSISVQLNSANSENSISLELVPSGPNSVSVTLNPNAGRSISLDLNTTTVNSGLQVGLTSNDLQTLTHLPNISVPATNASCDTWHLSCNISINDPLLTSIVAPNNIGIDSQSIFVVSDNVLINQPFITNAIQSGLVSNPHDIADALGVNSSLQLQFAADATPLGFAVTNGTVSTARDGTENTFISWQAATQPAESPVTIRSSSQGVTFSSGGLPSMFNNVYDYLALGPGNATVQTQQQIQAVSGIQNDSYATRYIMSNITIMSNDKAYVVGMTNMVGGVENRFDTHGLKQEFNNISVVVKHNFTNYDMAVIHNSNLSTSGCTTLACWKESIVKGVPPDSAPDLTYSYVFVNSTINDSEIVRVTYGFNVSKQWVQEQNISGNDVVLYRANATTREWEQLPTKLVGENATDYFYTAVSPGMSLYAIGSEGQNVSNSTSQQQQSGSIQTNSGNGSYEVAIAILVVVVATIVALWYMHGRKYRAKK